MLVRRTVGGWRFPQGNCQYSAESEANRGTGLEPESDKALPATGCDHPGESRVGDATTQRETCPVAGEVTAFMGRRQAPVCKDGDIFGVNVSQ